MLNLQEAGLLTGKMEGMIARQKYDLAANKDVREEGYLQLAQHADVRDEKRLSMDQEAFSWKREDRNKRQFIENGMAEAFQQGGYSGVIDFLQNNDPEKAIEFTNKKIQLDDNLMKSDVMRSLAPLQQAQAMTEAYGAMGQMGATLLKAAPEDRNAMYQQMLPILKKINPEAPDSLNDDAVAMFQLGVAQSMPANIFYANQKQLTSSQSAVGKLDADIRSRVQNGETPDNSPGLRVLMQELDAHSTKAQAAQGQLDALEFKNQQQAIQSAQNQAQANAAQYGLTANMNSKYMAEAKPYIDFTTQKAMFDGAVKSIASGSGGAGQTAAMRQVAMIFNKGQLGDRDVTAWANNDSDALVAIKKLRSTAGEEGQVVLNPREIQRLSILMDSIQQNLAAKQGQVNDRYKGMAQQFGVDPKNLNIYEPAAPAAYLDPSVPPEIAAQAKAAIQKGADPSAVNARVKQLMGKQ